MYTSLSCLFSFSCPHPPLSPDHPAGRSQDKPRRLRRGLGFRRCLMSAWDLVTQHAPKVPLRTDARTALWHPAPSSHLRTAGACLVLSAASLSSSSPIALPPRLLSYSFSLHPGAEQSQAGAGLLCLSVPPAEPQPAQLPAAATHLYLRLTRASTEGLFLLLLLICRVWWAIQMNRNHNCRVLKQRLDYITAFVFLHTLHKFIINYCVLLISLF